MYFEDTFFNVETRCGFEIPQIMKRTWAAQMELLKAVIDICDRNDLTYFADWGTLLGAVRHKGYIPWDDDIDICLKREDYDKLIKILPKELPDGLMMVGVHTKENGPFVVNTVQTRVAAYRGYWDMNEYIRYFHGYPFTYIAIDIFPLDIVPHDTGAYERQSKLITMAQTILALWEQLKEERGLEDSLLRFEKQSGIPFPPDGTEEEKKIRLLWSIDVLSSIYKDKDGDMLTEYAFKDKNPGLIMNKDWYREVTMLPFENMEIAVPCCYDEILSVQFGNYHEMVQKRGAHDYPFYNNMEKELCQELAEAGFTGNLDDFCNQVLAGEITLS